MAIEIFGFLFKPEISIGDIAAIAALISSALIFWLGYSRTRKSEQIKIGREHMDRLDDRSSKLGDKFKDLESKLDSNNKSPLKLDLSPFQKTSFGPYDYLADIESIIREIEYFDQLVTSHEVWDKNVLSYYSPTMKDTINSIDTKLKNVDEKKDDLLNANFSADIFKTTKQLRLRLDNISDTWKKRGSQ